jgi:mRNA interferase MazF
MNRGEIWIANLNPNKGTEPEKTRPVIIIQSDILNRVNHPSTLVIPLTSTLDPKPRTTTRLRITNRGRLTSDSDALVDQVVAISNHRFKEGPIAVLTTQELLDIKEILDPILGYYDQWTK